MLNFKQIGTLGLDAELGSLNYILRLSDILMMVGYV